MYGKEREREGWKESERERESMCVHIDVAAAQQVCDIEGE